MHNLKKNILASLEANDIDSVISLAKIDKKVLNHLVRLAYDKDSLFGWRAIKAIGLAAREIVKSDCEFLREMVRKLLWSLSDESGGIGWSAPEILGEIVSSDPARFQDIIPLIVEVYSIEEKVFRPGVLYALDRIGETNSTHITAYKGILFAGAQDGDPMVRVYAIRLLKRLIKSLTADETALARELLARLSEDRAEVWIYGDSGFENIQVREKALEVFSLFSDA